MEIKQAIRKPHDFEVVAVKKDIKCVSCGKVIAKYTECLRFKIFEGHLKVSLSYVCSECVTLAVQRLASSL